MILWRDNVTKRVSLSTDVYDDYTSGRDTNNNFNQHCQKHALITRHGKFRPFDTSNSRVDSI